MNVLETKALNIVKDAAELYDVSIPNSLKVLEDGVSELHQWRDSVRYLLDDPKFAPYVVRVCEGGGPEDLIMSLIVSWNKMFNALPKEEFIPNDWTGFYR